MRILVMSDSHGDYGRVRQAALAQQKAEIIIHCGDGEREIGNLKLDFQDKAIYGVRGNCDWGSAMPIEDFINVEGRKIMFTHGYSYYVKSGYGAVKQAARDNHADIVLFGHTHIPLDEYEDGLYVMNPGSIGGYGATYGVIEITPKGIMTNIVKMG